jgi:DnaA family protein
LLLDLIPPPRPSLGNFVTGRNREALAALRDVAVVGAAKVCYCWGAPGSGKTHLARALVDTGDWLAFSPALAQPDGHDVCVDDIHVLNDAEQQSLFNLINLQQQSAGSLIAFGGPAPRDLPMRRDLASRLGSGLVFQLHPLSDDEKAVALKAHAASRGFALRDDVLTYVLRHARRDMPSLMSFLDALDHHSIETGREITVPLVRELTQSPLGLSA